MITNPVHSSPAVQNEAAAKAAPRQSAAPQQASVPPDKVTISPQAPAQVQAQAYAQQNSFLCQDRRRRPQVTFSGFPNFTNHLGQRRVRRVPIRYFPGSASPSNPVGPAKLSPLVLPFLA